MELGARVGAAAAAAAADGLRAFPAAPSPSFFLGMGASGGGRGASGAAAWGCRVAAWGRCRGAAAWTIFFCFVTGSTLLVVEPVVKVLEHHRRVEHRR